MPRIRKLIFKIGSQTVEYLVTVGQLTVMTARAYAAMRKAPVYIRQIIDEFIYIGRYSLPIVIVTAVFMGLVLGIQIGTQISAGTPAWVEGGLILRSILLEMGPIIMGLVLAGRVGAGISSELGAMKVTEQIDALRIMGIDPIEFLVMPRLVAGMIAIPILIIYADVFAILAGFVSSHFTIALTWPGFVKGMRHVFAPTDAYTSVIKGHIFGVIIVSMSCYFGINSKRGATGVGAATTNTVIWSSITILVLDYVLSAILYFIW